jgi:hypothetical protein
MWHIALCASSVDAMNQVVAALSWFVHVARLAAECAARLQEQRFMGVEHSSILRMSCTRRASMWHIVL